MVRAVAMVSRLVVSHDSWSTAVALWPARSASTSAAAVSPVAERSTPAREVIVSCSSLRAPPATRPAVRPSGEGSRHSPSSAGSTVAMRRANTSPSSSEFDASRLAPWTPEQATSPLA